MASSWGRKMGNIRSLIGNSMGGLRGGTNLASWVVAGSLAYYLWVKPSQDLKRQQQERVALAAAEKGNPTPVPHLDPQQSGLVHGNKNRSDKLEE